MVSDAIGLDKRIGRRYLTGGFGYGGPCFPRDNVALNFVGDHLGASCELLHVNDEFNRGIAERYVNRLRPYLRNNSTVAVLGLAYKPLSHVIEESSGIFLCKALSSLGLRVIGFDPLANDAARTALQNYALVADSLRACLQDAETVLITTPDDAFKQFTGEDYLGEKSSVTLIDFWRCLPESTRNHPGIRYIPMGHCLDDSAAASALKGLWRGGSNSTL